MGTCLARSIVADVKNSFAAIELKLGKKNADRRVRSQTMCNFSQSNCRVRGPTLRCSDSARRAGLANSNDKLLAKTSKTSDLEKPRALGMTSESLTLQIRSSDPPYFSGIVS